MQIKSSFQYLNTKLVEAIVEEILEEVLDVLIGIEPRDFGEHEMRPNGWIVVFKSETSNYYPVSQFHKLEIKKILLKTTQDLAKNY